MCLENENINFSVNTVSFSPGHQHSAAADRPQHPAPCHEGTSHGLWERWGYFSRQSVSSACLCVCMSVCLTDFLSVCLSLYLICLCVGLTICLSVCFAHTHACAQTNTQTHAHTHHIHKHTHTHTHTNRCPRRCAEILPLTPTTAVSSSPSSPQGGGTGKWAGTRGK